MIVYDMVSLPEMDNGMTAEDLFDFSMKSGILLYDSSNGGDKPYYLGESKEEIKIVDTKGLNIKDFTNGTE